MKKVNRCDCLSHQGTSKFQGEDANSGLALRMGDQFLSCIGQWSQYTTSIEVNPRRVDLDLWTQIRVLVWIAQLRQGFSQGRLALGLDETDLFI